MSKEKGYLYRKVSVFLCFKMFFSEVSKNFGVILVFVSVGPVGVRFASTLTNYVEFPRDKIIIEQSV